MKTKARFTVQQYRNPATGTISWRVSGTDREGKRYRENFADRDFAVARQLELEAQWLGRGLYQAQLKPTTLTDTQIEIATAAFHRLPSDQTLLDAVEHWLRFGQPSGVNRDVRLDEALERFLEWTATAGLREPTVKSMKSRLLVFASVVGDMPVHAITPGVIRRFLDTRSNNTPASREADKRAVSSFCNWCVRDEQRFLATNPTRGVQVDGLRRNGKEPEILSVSQCRALLDAARTYREGRLLPYVALGLFGGLRPTEAAGLRWDNINFADKEVVIPSEVCKTGRRRVIELNATLAVWLKVCNRKVPLIQATPDNDMVKLRKLAGIEHWPADVMRHTCISHYFRQCGSLGLTAEMAGNSESVILRHYKSRTSTPDTKAFWSLRPK